MTVRAARYRRIPDEAPLSAWETAMDRMPRHSFFQTPAWADIALETIPGSHPGHLLLRFSDGAEAILPRIAVPRRFGLRKWESMPWGTYGGLVGVNTGPEHLRAALDLGRSPLAPVSSATVHPLDYAEHTEWEAPGFRLVEKTTHLLKLDGPFEEIEHRFQSRTRTAIRKARNEDIEICCGNGSDAIGALRDLYANAAGRHGGALAIPPAFFDALERHGGKGVLVWTALHKGQAVAADLMLYGKNEAQYHTGARDAERAPDGTPKLLMAEIIRHACGEGIGWLNLGASAGIAGVERFKELFGAKKTLYAAVHRFPGAWLDRLAKRRQRVP